MNRFYLFLIPILFLGSCYQNEDELSLSLGTKKSRLTKTWYIESHETDNGLLYVKDQGDYLDFDRDYTFTVYDGYSWNQMQGTWEFSDNKKEIITKITIQNGTQEIVHEDTYEILELKKNSLKLRTDFGEIWHLTP